MRDALTSGVLGHMNNDLLNKNAVYTSKISLNRWNPQSASDYDKIMDSVKQECAQHPDASTLIFSFSKFANNPKIFKKLHSYLETIFPNTKIVAFYSISNPFYTHRGNLLFDIWYKYTLPLQICQQPYQTPHANIDQIFEILNEIMPSDVHIHVHEGSENSALEAQNAFWKFVGIDLPIKKLPINFNVPKEFFQLLNLSHRSAYINIENHPNFWNKSLNFTSKDHAFSLFCSEDEYDNFIRNIQKETLLLKKHLILPPNWEIPCAHDATIDKSTALNATRLQKSLSMFYDDNSTVTIDSTYAEEDIVGLIAILLNAKQKNIKLNPDVSFTPPQDTVLCVLTATYNHAKYIAQNIESVIAQKTDFPIVHIIADDASDDGTREIVLDYAKKYKHIIPIFHKYNICAHNYLSLFNRATSPYVALCDGDDYFTDPLKLQKQVDFLENNPHCSMCFHLVKIIFDDNEFSSKTFPPLEQLPRGVQSEYYLTDLLRTNMMQTSSVVYRWRFQEGLPDWFNIYLRPGDWYWHLLHAEKGKIGFLQDIMSVYRRHKSAVYYESEFSELQHRATQGIAELRVYKTVNEHFENRYFRLMASLANSVFSNFLEIYLTEKDDTLLNKASELYPEFAKHFLASIQITKKK